MSLIAWIALAAVIVSLAALVLAVQWWFKMRETAKVIGRIAPALAEASEFFALIDISAKKSHFLERHGPMLTKCDVLQRAETGRLDVSGHVSKPVTSAKWLRHADLLRAVVSAAEHWSNGAQPKRGGYVFEFENEIGEGFLKGGGDIVRTKLAIVIIRKGDIITAYPLLAPSKANYDLRPL